MSEMKEDRNGDPTAVTTTTTTDTDDNNNNSNANNNNNDDDNIVKVVEDSCDNNNNNNQSNLYVRTTKKRRLDDTTIVVVAAASEAAAPPSTVNDDKQTNSIVTTTTNTNTNTDTDTTNDMTAQQLLLPQFQPKKKLKKKHIDPLILQFRNTIQQCCKNNDLHTAIASYNTAIRQQTRIEAQSFYNLLHLCSNATNTNTTNTNNHSSSGSSDLERMEEHMTTTYSTKEDIDHQQHRNVVTTKIHIGTPKTTTTAIATTTTTTTTASTTQSETTTSPPLLLLLVVVAVSIHDRRSFAERVKQHMDQLHIPLTENAYTALVRVYCQGIVVVGVQKSTNSLRDDTTTTNNNKYIEAAIRTITEAEYQSRSQKCHIKLRLYTPLLQIYCQLGYICNAVQLWHRISKQQHEHQQPQLALTELEYCALLQCCCTCSCLVVAGLTTTTTTTATTTSATATIAAMVFEQVLSDLAEDICIPSHLTRQTIVQWFQSKYAVVTVAALAENHDDNNINNNCNDTTATTLKSDDDDVIFIKELLHQIHQTPTELTDTSTAATTTICMGPVQCSINSSNINNNNNSDHVVCGWTISDQCRIDVQTGTLLSGCLQNSILQPISISPKTWDTMKQMNENIAITNKINDTDTTNYQGGGKGRKVILDDRAIQQRRNHWNQFHTFLLTQPDVDVLIDGANVGYYEQNFNGAPKHVDYNQINWLVQHLLRTQSKKVLLIMHSRHFASNLMPKSAESIVQEWRNLNLLYETPPGMNDDWFWLHAALHYGPGTHIVTNDEMRDHHFQMIAPRAFVRWRDRHQIHFSFGQWMVHDHNINTNTNNNEESSNGNSQKPIRRREVVLQYPDPYSRRIQRVLPDGLVIPLPKRGDTNRFMDGVFVADDNEPNEEMYLCIRPTPTHK